MVSRLLEVSWLLSGSNRAGGIWFSVLPQSSFFSSPEHSFFLPGCLPLNTPEFANIPLKKRHQEERRRPACNAMAQVPCQLLNFEMLLAFLAVIRHFCPRPSLQSVKGSRFFEMALNRFQVHSLAFSQRSFGQVAACCSSPGFLHLSRCF